MLGALHVEDADRRSLSPLGGKGRHAQVDATVLGVSKPERVAETLEWADWKIPEAVWDELKQVPYSTDNPQAPRA